MEEITDPDELRRARQRRERFDRNSAWLQAHIPEIYGRHRGSFICVANQQLFVSNSVEDAVAQAKAAHPDDDGLFTRYIPTEKLSRIYAL